MKIACPDCSAAYEVPSDRVRPGRAVKCARCGGTWTPVESLAPVPGLVPEPVSGTVEAEPGSAPPLPDFGSDVGPAFGPDAGPPPDVVPESVPAPLPAPVRRRRPLLALGWLLTVAVLAVALTAGVVRRTEIMQAWPPSQRLYAALGLAP